MTCSEDIRQHITKHDIKTVLRLLGNHNWSVLSSAHETVSELVKYGVFQEQHDILRLIIPSEDI
jgi:hypothetical protein